MKKKSFLMLLLFVLLITEDVLSQGCSQCKMLAEQGSEMEEASFGTSINSGILYLMTIPYLIILFLFREKIIGFFKGLAKK
jgi:hypothetical protein